MHNRHQQNDGSRATEKYFAAIDQPQTERLPGRPPVRRHLQDEIACRGSSVWSISAAGQSQIAVMKPSM